MNFAFAHFYPENGCEYTSIFRVYTYTHTCMYMYTYTRSSSSSIIFRT